MAKDFKITYTTMSADDPELHKAFDEVIERVKKLKGKTYPLLIGGEEVEADDTFPVYNPADTRDPLVYFQKASTEDAQRAISAAKDAFPAWSQTPWEERCDIVDDVADMISDNQMELSAMMIMEMGKNRVEAMGDVQESADLLRYYAYQMRENDGYVRRMNSFGKNDVNLSILKPYGVWSVISPFNFPLALAAGPVAAALVTGNTCILKPSSDAPWTAYKLIEYFIEAGVPAGAANFITGPGRTAGNELVENPDVDGITFTGSYDVGFNKIYHEFATKYPKPVVVEMGGKNPAIVSKDADLDVAVTGVMRSAFGMGGQKCSACSRIYVHKDVYETFLEKFIAKTDETVKIGDPLERETFLGPLVNESALEDYKRFMKKAREDGNVLYGGGVLDDGDFEHGYFVQPAIITGLPHEHELIQTELFVPITYIEPVDSLDEAMEKANDVEYGLTAGFYGTDEEVKWFLKNIEAGVVYVNREGGATTGAWPGYQTFGGWKGSGSSGRNIGGHYTLLNYVREQSQTIIQA